MRSIRQYNNMEDALVHRDLLYANHIDSEVEEEGKNWLLWVLNDDDLEQAQEILTRIPEETTEEHIKDKVELGRQLRAEAIKKEKAARTQYKDVRTMWAQKSMTDNKVTWSLMAACIVVGLVTGLGSNRTMVSYLTITSLFGFGGAPDFLQGQVWRIFTPMFLHFGLLHIVFNLWWLKDLGAWIEQKEGRKTFIWMVLSISGISNLAQYFVSGPFFGGMSGVNFGLLAYIWIRGRLDPHSGYYLDQTTVVIMGIWFMLGWFQVVPGMANIVHTMGLVSGLGWAYIKSGKR